VPQVKRGPEVFRRKAVQLDVEQVKNTTLNNEKGEACRNLVERKICGAKKWELRGR
jgi:hypothetical protein